MHKLNSSGSSTTRNTMLVLAAFVIVVAGMKVASPLIVPILLSLFIATISAPPLLWLKDKGLPTFLAMLVVIGFILGAGILIVTLVGASLAEFQDQLPVYEQRLDGLFANVSALAAKFEISLNFADIASVINPASVATGVGKLINEIGSLIANAFLIFIVVVFMLFEVSTLPEKLKAMMSRPVDSIERLSNFKSSLQRYLIIKTATSLTTALLVWILLTVLGVDFAVLWALLAFFLNFVPNIGSVIAAIPAVMIALLQTDMLTTVWVALGYLVINSLVGTVIEPKVAGRHLGLSPLIVFLSLVFWGYILGPVGMFLSVPLTMVVRLVAESSDDTRWISILLSERVHESDAGSAGGQS